MRNYIIIILIFSIHYSFSQKKGTDTIFFDKNWKKCAKKKASYYRILTPLKDKLWLLQDYYADTNTIQAQGKTTNGKDQGLHGKITWYHKTGEIINKAYFLKGKQCYKEEFDTYNLKKKYNIDLDNKNLLKIEKGYLTKDTISDYIFITSTPTSRTLIFQFNTPNKESYNQYFDFNKEENLYDAKISNNRCILFFKSNKRLYNWERQLFFEIIKNYNLNDDYDENLYILKLVKDNANASRRLKKEKINISKTSKNFGNVFLNSFTDFTYKDSLQDFTWKTIKKTIEFKEENEDTLYDFLSNIKDDTIINLSSGIYNFSSPNYFNKEYNENKYISLENGTLKIVGFANLKIIGHQEVIFSTDNEDMPVLELINCKNITLKNIEGIHNVPETYCEASVFDIYNSKNIYFDKCTADGSGKYGFQITGNSTDIYIKNSVITNCTYNAIKANYGNIYITNTSIINNTFKSKIFFFDGCNKEITKPTIKIDNCIISDNTLSFVTDCPNLIEFKNTNIEINKGKKNSSTNSQKLILKNSKLIFKN